MAGLKVKTPTLSQRTREGWGQPRVFYTNTSPGKAVRVREASVF